MSKVELKPCPFCGSEPVERMSKIDGNTYCGCWDKEDCPMAGWVTAKEWNTRPIEDALNARIAELENKQRWISVKDKLPEYKTPYDYVLVCDADGGGYAIAWRDSPYEGGKVWCFSSDLWVDEHVTHWMHLPQPPEVQE